MSSSESGTASPEDDIYLLDDNSTTGTCSVCVTYEQEGKLDFPSYVASVSAVVHQTCSECDAFKVDESQLCDFCIHIRPAHFMTCRCVLDLCDENISALENCIIVIGTLSELKSRQGSCAFCQWCLEVVQADARLRQLIIDEREAIHIRRGIEVEKMGLFVRHGERKAHTEVVFKTRRSNSADGGDDGKSRSSFVSIGYNKEFVRSFDLFGDETLVALGPKISLITPVADWAAVGQWRSRCEFLHELCGESASGTLPNHFRLIDVANKRIINANRNPPSFFALSYVWGAGSERETALRQGNLSELRKSGGLHNLPRTITDAMHVCERLGQAFLWVDRFCIIQDNKEDKYGQIRSLEAIYSRAELVIIAACGHDMQSGLAGVNGESSRGQNQFSVDIFGFTMANKLQGFNDALQCKWSERGWTYQEAVLAKRKLYLTPAELWFECAEVLERENPFSEGWNKPHGNRLITHRSQYAGEKALCCGNERPSGDTFEEYGHHLEQYSNRVLTYPSDIYHAFHGIEDAFYPESQIIFGLPESDFNRALLWRSRAVKDLKERQCKEQNIILPTWSWASLIGQVEVCPLFGDDLRQKFCYQGSFYCSLCIWATLGVMDEQTLVPINSTHDEKVWASLDKFWSESPYFSDHPTHRQFLALAWAKGCIEADVPTDLIAATYTRYMAMLRSSIRSFWTEVQCRVRLTEDQSHPTYFDLGQLQPSSFISAQDLKLRWPTIQDFWADVRNKKHQRKDHPQPIGLDKGHILTRTQSSTMNVELSRREQNKDGTRPKFVIRHTNTHSADDEIVGWISSEDEYKLRATVKPEEIARVDFIALAIGYLPEWEAKYLDNQTLRKNCFDQNYSGKFPWQDQPGVIVMAVRWTGPVARRIGLGWVTLQGWVDSKPEFRTVILA